MKGNTLTVITFKVPMTSAASFAYGDFKDTLESEFDAEVSAVTNQQFTVRVADTDVRAITRNAPFTVISSEVD